MNKRIQAIVVMTLLSVSGATTAQQQPAEADKGNEPDRVEIARADDDRMVCERVKAIGSNKVERVCKTAKERREEREGALYQRGKQATDRAFEKRNVCASPTCACVE